MKKKLEAELISIAHRILKLKGKEDVVLLHQETQKLYEKLSILRFYEENFEALKPTLTHQELEEKMETAYQEKPVVAEEPKTVAAVIEEDKPIAPIVAEVEEPVAATPETEEEIVVEEEKVLIGQIDIDESDIEEEEPVLAVEEVQEEIIEPLFEPTSEELVEEVVEAIKDEKQPQQISFEDLLGDSYKEPEFVKVDEVPAEVEKAADIVFEKASETVVAAEQEEVIAETPKKEVVEAIKETIAKEKEEYKTTSLNLNDKFSKTISLGLNDRISFEKHLFDGSGEDLNRVVSQLNTFNSLDEAQSFIDDLVKPDYNNWKGKDEFVERFMELVEKKFA